MWRACGAHQWPALLSAQLSPTMVGHYGRPCGAARGSRPNRRSCGGGGIRPARARHPGLGTASRPFLSHGSGPEISDPKPSEPKLSEPGPAEMFRAGPVHPAPSFSPITGRDGKPPPRRRPEGAGRAAEDTPDRAVGIRPVQRQRIRQANTPRTPITLA